MSDSLYQHILQQRCKYSEKSVVKSIVYIKNSTNEKLIDKHKQEIVKYTSKIILRNVANFFNQLRGLDQSKIHHSKDDIVSECYLIINNCIEKFDLRSGYKFYFYLNKSMMRGLNKLKKESYRGESGSPFIDAIEICKFDWRTFSTEENNPLLLEKIFTKKEVLLMQSRVQEQTIDEFIKSIEISRTEYHKILKRIREKINKNYFR